MSMHLTDDELLHFLEGEKDAKLAEHLTDCPECSKKLNQLSMLLTTIENSKEAEPSASLRWELLAAIEEEKKSAGGNRSWLRVAAVVSLLIVSFLIGKWSTSDHSDKLAAIENEVAELKNASFQQMAASQSASQRITAVNQVEYAGADRALITTLIKILNTDESPNVRYAAVQALGQMMNDDLVKNQLVKSLEIQTDPLIQIALITLLTEADEKSAIAPVKDLLKNENTSPEVKHQAEIALQILI